MKSVNTRRHVLENRRGRGCDGAIDRPLLLLLATCIVSLLASFLSFPFLFSAVCVSFASIVSRLRERVDGGRRNLSVRMSAASSRRVGHSDAAINQTRREKGESCHLPDCHLFAPRPAP